MNTMPSNLKDTLLTAIKTGEAKQKPKWYFVFVMLLGALGALVLFIVMVYLISFISLVSYEHELVNLLSFGPRGVFAFMYALPWLIIFCVIVIAIVLYILVRDYAFVYTRPVIYGILGALVISSLISYAMCLFDNNKFIVARFGEDNSVPLLGDIHDWYRDGQPSKDIVHGDIISTTTSGFLIKDFRGGTIYAVVFPEEMDTAHVVIIGSKVTIFGERGTSTIKGFGVRIFDPHINPLPELRPRKNQ